MTFSDYLAHSKTHQDSGPVYYISHQNNSLREEDEFAGILSDDVDSEFSFSSLALGCSPEAVNFWCEWSCLKMDGDISLLTLKFQVFILTATFTHSIHSHTHTHIYIRTLSLTHSLTHTHTLPLSLSLWRFKDGRVPQCDIPSQGSLRKYILCHRGREDVCALSPQ